MVKLTRCLKPEIKCNLTFKVSQGPFEWLAMPFSHTNVPTTFTRIRNALLRLLCFNHDLVFTRMRNEVIRLLYFIHYLVFRQHTCFTLEDHLHHLNQVFGVLHGDKLLVNKNKCTFKQCELIYLRLCQNQNGLSIE